MKSFIYETGCKKYKNREENEKKRGTEEKIRTEEWTESERTLGTREKNKYNKRRRGRSQSKRSQKRWRRR